MLENDIFVRTDLHTARIVVRIFKFDDNLDWVRRCMALSC